MRYCSNEDITTCMLISHFWGSKFLLTDQEVKNYGS